MSSDSVRSTLVSGQAGRIKMFPLLRLINLGCFITHIKVCEPSETVYFAIRRQQNEAVTYSISGCFGEITTDFLKNIFFEEVALLFRSEQRF